MASLWWRLTLTASRLFQLMQCHFVDVTLTASRCVCSLFTPIKRGAPVWSYVITADERLMELDYDRLVFEADSPWQNIRIFHSTEHGNVLFLDADLSEWE